MYLLPYLPAVVSTPCGIPGDTRRYAKGHSSATSYKRLAHLVISSHILRKPALSNVLCSVPRFTTRCVLGESRVLFCVGLASEANLRKKVSYYPESDDARAVVRRKLPASSSSHVVCVEAKSRLWAVSCEGRMGPRAFCLASQAGTSVGVCQRRRRLGCSAVCCVL